jgi:hypothetical protein
MVPLLLEVWLWLAPRPLKVTAVHASTSALALPPPVSQLLLLLLKEKDDRVSSARPWSLLLPLLH